VELEIKPRWRFVDFGLIPSPTSVSSLFGRRFESYKLTSHPSL